MGPEVTLKIDDRSLKAAMKQFPKIANQEFNRGLQRITGGFYKAFKPRLTGRPGIKVVRQLAENRSKGGVPAVARAIGFRAKYINREKLDGKSLILGSSEKNPIAMTHEFGATISGKPFLAIGEPHRFVSKGGLRHAGALKTGKLIRLARTARIPARLGFFATWASFQLQARLIMAKVAQRIVERANKMTHGKPAGGARGAA